MFVRRNTDKLPIAIAALILFVVLGYRPQYRLSSAMPRGFFLSDKEAPESSSDQKIAWAYWQSARMDIQWKYGYSHPLPTAPPPEFRVDAAELGLAASDPYLRLLYWHRLQQVWPLDDTWSKEYGWRMGWLTNPLLALVRWITDAAHRAALALSGR